MNYDIEEQVDRLETLLGQFIVQTNMGFKKVNRGLTRLENEMREFKDEMRAFKDEMREFKNEMGAFKDEMGEFKNEMGEFKDEMKKSQELRDIETRRMNQRWGDVVNKWGKLVEDLVAPNFETIIKQKFNLEINELFVRHKRKLAPGQVKEFDLIAVTEEFVFLNSTKSTLLSNHVDELIDEIKIFWKLYPEFHNLKLIGVLSSIYTDNSVLNYAGKKGILVMGVGLELMELKNDPKFEPKIWTYSAKN
ncbi:hypothetical protein JW964_14880 [candidate division KSB1 bacterium]|nr:hypothetical protein [candidate division KSB1 bacterium]